MIPNTVVFICLCVIWRELQQLGVNTSKYDEAIFFWRHDNDLHGILCSYEDDFFWGGSQLFKTKVIEAIKRRFQISQEESNAFTYVGLEIKDNKEGIVMHQKSYINEIDLIPVSKERLSDKHSVLSNEELRP